LLASIAVLLRAYWSTFSSLLRGIDRVSNEVVLFSASRMVEFIGIIVSLVIGGSLTVVIILIIGCNCLTILGTLLLVRKVFVKPSFRFDTQSIRTAVREGFPFALASIFTAIYFNVDTVLLSKFIDAKTAGVYRAAYNLVLPLMMVTSAVAAAVFPYVSQQYKTNKEQVTHIFRRAVSLLLLLALPTAVITTFLAPEIISFLFAPEYGAASSSLALLIWFLPFAYVTNLYGHTLGAMDDQPFVIRVNAVNAAFNLAANLIFIPFFAQTAAAATTVLTEILGFSILSVRIRRYFPAVVEPLLLLKIFFALMLTVPFLVFHPPMNVLIALALALLNYAIALLLVKAITLKDLREILFLMKPPQQEQ
ncbi:MAG TPA: oligosaccharide flippase family protein, partial [Bacteroidota bacterium]